MDNIIKKEEVIFSSPGVLVKKSEDVQFERPFTQVIHVQHVEGVEDEDYLYLVGSGIPMTYPTPRDAIQGSEGEGKIEFSSYGNNYELRNFTEEDSDWFTGFGLPLSPKMMEEIVAKDAEVGVSQSVEAITDESGELVGVIYTVENLGSFSRVDGEWKAGAAEGDEERDDDITLVGTPIKYLKAAELVERFDAGETITEKEIDENYASDDAKED